MKAEVNKDTCIGCGVCATICPNVFALDEEDDLAKTILEIIPPENENDCREAAEQCPTEAISIE